MTDPKTRARGARIVRRLAEAYPDAKCALEFSSPLELLIATILAAQCTDERVNQVARTLFRKYPDAAAYARADLAQLEEDVRPTGFFRNKAKAVQGTGKALVERHGGQVPDRMEALVELPGAARKTANLVLAAAFGRAEGIVVDTHVGRISQRLELTSETDAAKIERDLMDLLPREEWIRFVWRMMDHGRQVCVAKSPRCDGCPLRPDCPYPDRAGA